MTILSDVPHNARMIHGAVTALNLTLFARGMYLDRLQAAIDAGLVIEPESEAEIALANDVKTLRRLAHRLLRRRRLGDALQAAAGRAVKW